MTKRRWETGSALKVVVFCMLFALMVTLTTKVEAAGVPTIKYQAHIQNSGWLSAVKGGKTAGSTGRSMRLEALKIILANKGTSMISYRAHVSNIGWQGWKRSGQTAGTTGKSCAIEAVQIKLTGAYAKKYDIYYRVHVPHRGWLGWAKNGSTAGSTGMGLRTEAIQIKLVKKNSAFARGGKASLTKPKLTYKGHSQDYGWGNNVVEGATAGTTGKAKRLEALVVNYRNFDGGNGITYRAHVSSIGWQSWVNSGKTAGTTGKGKAIEAVQIRLTGGMDNLFDVYYRMHVAENGWLGWAKNGEITGTTGGGIRAEAIQIRIVVKGASFDVGGSHYIDASNNGIKLRHYMTQSLKQPYSGPCCAYAYGIGLSIVLRKNVDPMQFYRNGLAHYDWGRVGAYRMFNASAIYEALRNGKPTMIHYTYPGNQHWVLITGVRNGANPGNLNYSDFICIDSAYGDERPLTSAWMFAAGSVQGIKIFS